MAGLTTKLLVPPVRPRLVPRDRLTRLLEGAAEAGVPLSLVCAPPGFGKTAVVTQWLQACGRACAWLTLDAGDNDPGQFLAYLTAGLSRLDERLGSAASALLRSPQPPPAAAVIAQLINDIADAGRPLTLVLDDYHLIESAAVHDALRLLLERLPPGVNVVVITRHDPTLPVARLRAKAQLLELREPALRFTADESAEFLRECMSLDLADDALRRLHERTEGWVAGLQLAALTLAQRPQATAELTAAFDGHDRYLVDYLISEVLDQQTPEMRDFLRRTAVLERLSGPLCDWLLEAEGSQAKLEELEARNLFLVPLDNHRQWFRYHGLFAEFLAGHLAAAERVGLHERAAQWCARQGLVEQAVRHALASGNHTLASSLVADAAEETLHAGAVLTLTSWLEALPGEVVRGDGRLANYAAWAYTLTGRMAEGEALLDRAESLLREGGAGGELGKALTLRALNLVLLRRDYSGAAQVSREALDLLENAAIQWRIIALWTLAEAQERTAPLPVAIATLREARALGRSLENLVFVSAIEDMLVADLHQHGLRLEALGVCAEALGRFSGPTGRLSPLAGLLASRRGQLHHEANELDEARTWLERGLELSNRLGVDAQRSFSLGALAPTLHALGERERAYALLREAYELTVASGLADPAWLLANEATLRIRDGDLAAAAAWAAGAGLSPDEPPEYLRLEPLIVFARLLLAQGRVQEARRLLAKLERFTSERGFRRNLITVWILQALASEAWGDRAAALERLTRALRAAAPEAYLRAYLDEGPRLHNLLATASEAAPALVEALLAFGSPASEATPDVPGEAPTAREGEVLALIAAGLDNAEIAAELGLAVATVKRHINGLYGKLGVDSRTRAIVRARELGLLPEGRSVRS